jgi:hypothetical protein
VAQDCLRVDTQRACGVSLFTRLGCHGRPRAATKDARDGAGQLIECDLSTEGVVITFSDGQAFIFDPDFLHSIRDRATFLTEGETDDSNYSSLREPPTGRNR